MKAHYGWLVTCMLLTACGSSPNTAGTDMGTTGTTDVSTGTSASDPGLVGSTDVGAGAATGTDAGTTGGTDVGTTIGGDTGAVGTATGGTTTGTDVGAAGGTGTDVGAVGSTGGGGGGTTTPAAGVGQGELTPAFYLAEIARANRGEVNVSLLALDRAVDEDVRAYAQKMVDEHEAAMDDIREVAEGEGVTLPALLASEAYDARARLLELTGAEFDREYMRFALSSHQAAIRITASMAANPADDDVQALAADLLPDLEEHLDEAEDVAAGVNVTPRTFDDDDTDRDGDVDDDDL
jgi:putative membrane protein